MAQYKNTIHLNINKYKKNIKQVKKLHKSVNTTIKKQSKTMNKLKSVTKKVTRGYNKFKQTIRRLTVTAGAFLATVGVMTKKLADNVAQVEDIENAFAKAFKSSTKDVKDWAKTLGKEIRRSRISIMKYATEFQSIILPYADSMGVAIEETVNMSKRLTELALDVASFKDGISDMQALNAFKSGVVGNTKALRALGIDLTQATVEATAMSEGIEKNFKQLSFGKKVLLRYKTLLKNTKFMQSDAKDTAYQLENSMKNLSDTVKRDLSNSFGKILAPAMTHVVNKMTDFANFLIDLPVETKKNIIRFTALLSVLSTLVLTLSLLITVIEPIVMLLGGFNGIIRLVSKGVISLVKSFGLIILKFVGISSLLILVGALFSKLGFKIAELLGVVNKDYGFKDYWEDIKYLFSELIKNPKRFFKLIIDKLIDTSKQVKDLTSIHLENLMSKFKLLGKKIKQWFSDKITNAIDKVKDVINSLQTKIKNTMNKLNNLLGNISGGRLGGNNPTIRAPQSSDTMEPKSGILSLFNIFKKGGYTGSGDKNKPAGIVHAGEYVIPKWMVNKNPELISNLESKRRKGYADGGGVGFSVPSSIDNVLKYLKKVFSNIFNFAKGKLKDIIPKPLLKAFKTLKKVIEDTVNIFEKTQPTGIGEENGVSPLPNKPFELLKGLGSSKNLKEYISSLSKIDKKAKIFGDSLEKTLSKKIDITKSSISNLVDKGFDPTSQEVVYLSDNLKKLKEKFNKVSNEVISFGEKLKKGLQEKFPKITKFLKSIKSGIKSGKDTFQKAKSESKGGSKGGLKGALKSALGGLKAGLKGMLGGLKAALSPLIGIIIELLSKTKSFKAIMSALSNVVGEIVKALEPIMALIAQLFIPGLERLGKAIRWIGEEIITPVVNFIIRMINGVIELINRVIGTINNIPGVHIDKLEKLQSVSKYVDTLGDEAEDTAKAVEEANKQLNKLPDGIKTAVKRFEAEGSKPDKIETLTPIDPLDTGDYNKLLMKRGRNNTIERVEVNFNGNINNNSNEVERQVKNGVIKAQRRLSLRRGEV